MQNTVFFVLVLHDSKTAALCLTNSFLENYFLIYLQSVTLSSKIAVERHVSPKSTQPIFYGGEQMQIGYRQIPPGTGHGAGRQLLAELYRQATGKEMPPVLVTDRGKPYFASGDYHFSISHTKRHVFCVLSDRPVGIDAEEADRNIELRLADKILSPAEREHWENSEDKRLTLLKFWVLKEAAVKCTGQGLQGYPNHTEFDPEDPRVRMIDGCLVAVIEE